MKIDIDDQKRSDIEAFLSRFSSAMESLRDTSERVGDLQNRQDGNQAALSELTQIDDPSDKQIQSLIIARERATILQDRLNAITPQVTLQKRETVRLSNDAAELFRRAAGTALSDRAEAELKASLPPAITSDPHVLFKVWHEGAEKRRIGQFLNPPSANVNDDVETILDEARRRSQLLEDLVHGREIVSEVQTAAT